MAKKKAGTAVSKDADCKLKVKEENKDKGVVNQEQKFEENTKSKSKKKLTTTKTHKTKGSKEQNGEVSKEVESNTPGTNHAKKSGSSDQSSKKRKIDEMKESPVSKEANKQKKKRRKKKKKAKHQKQQQTETPNGDEASTPSTRTNEMTDYLQLWKDNRIEWKFRKKIQVLLLKCCYDEEKVYYVTFLLFLQYCTIPAPMTYNRTTAQLPEEYFNIFVDYIKNLQGHSRKQTLEEAERIQKEQGSEVRMNVFFFISELLLACVYPFFTHLLILCLLLMSCRNCSQTTKAKRAKRISEVMSQM